MVMFGFGGELYVGFFVIDFYYMLVCYGGFVGFVVDFL